MFAHVLSFRVVSGSGGESYASLRVLLSVAREVDLAVHFERQIVTEDRKGDPRTEVA